MASGRRIRLTSGQLNRTLLARQLLLERVPLSIPEALDRLCGIQNQYAPNAYIRLWSCLASFERESLTQAYESSAAVQGTLMRGTIHTVSAGDYHLLAAAIREPMRAWARRIHKSDDADRESVVALVRGALAGRSMKRTELVAMIDGASKAVRQTIDIDAELVRVPPSGSWARRRADLMGLADDLMPHRAVSAEAARIHLVRRYVGGFGPASADSIATFCGIPTTTLRPTLDAMGLRAFEGEDGALLYDLPDAAIMPADMPAPIRFLPTWDAILLVHARRAHVLPEEHRAYLFNKKVPHSFPTFMVDGYVRGTWRWNDDEHRVVIEPLEKFPERTLDDVAEAATSLAEFHR